MRKSLEEFYLPQVAELKYGNFSYGWFIGTGTLIPTGEIADIFKSSWLFNIGLTAGYKRFMLKADISYGQPDLVDLPEDAKTYLHRAGRTGRAGKTDRKSVV